MQHPNMSDPVSTTANVKKVGRPSLQLKRSAIEALFELPQPVAAQHLGVSVSRLKRECRKLGISLWPYKRNSHPSDGSDSGKDKRSSRPADDSDATACPAGAGGVGGSDSGRAFTSIKDAKRSTLEDAPRPASCSPGYAANSSIPLFPSGESESFPGHAAAMSNLHNLQLPARQDALSSTSCVIPVIDRVRLWENHTFPCIQVHKTGPSHHAAGRSVSLPHYTPTVFHEGREYVLVKIVNPLGQGTPSTT